MSIEKRSGRVIFESDSLNAQNFWGVRVDNRAGTIDFLSYNARITHSPALAEDKDSTSATEGAQATPDAAERVLKEEVRRRAIERARIREIVPPPPG